MNLYEGVQRVEDHLQYAPDLLAYRRDIRRVYSEVYLQLCTERPWPFLHTAEPLRVFPDIAITNSQLTRAGPRTFSINAGVVLEGVMYDATDSDAFEILQQFLPGAEFDLADRTLAEAGTGNWALAPFVIDNIEAAEGSLFLFLDQRCNCAALAAGLGDYVIRFRRTRLPARCDSILAIMDAENRPLAALPQSLWRAYQENPDETGGLPSYIVQDGGWDSRLPTYVSAPMPALTTSGSVDSRQLRNIPVYQDPPFVGVAGAAGTLLANATYRAFCCWVYGGRYGPPSKIVSVTVGATTPSIAYTDFPVAAAAAGTDTFGDTGRRIAIFIAEGDSGPFLEANIQLTGFDTTFDLAGRLTTTQLVGSAVGLRRWDEVYPGGPYQYVRIWPRPSETTTLRLEYIRRPRQLVSDVDEPELPEAFHRVLVHRTIIEMGIRFGVGASIMVAQKALLKEALAALYNRYLPQMMIRKQKGLLGAGRTAGPNFPSTLDFQS